MNEVVAVTGGTGFVGSHLVRRLVEAGKKVRVLARFPEKAKTLWPTTSVEIFKGNVTDPDSIKPFLDGAAQVFHLASILQEPSTPNKVFWDVHVEGTRHMLEESKRAGVKNFIHFSTIGVLGAPKILPANEETPYQARDIYQITKCEGEKLALETFRRDGLPGTVIRPAAVYGPGDMRLYKLFKFIADGKFRMIGKGDIFIHPVHVDDVVSGALLAAEKKEAHGQVYILGGEKAVQLKDFVERIAQILGVSLKSGSLPFWPVWLAAAFCEGICKPLGIQPPLFRRRVDFFAKSRAFDIAKARRDLGYTPRYSLDEGLRQTIRWYQSEGLL